jgi:hypothetical protein
MRNIS